MIVFHFENTLRKTNANQSEGDNMKHLMIFISVFFIMNKIFAAPLPSEITDDYMKVSTTNLVMQLLPETFYNIKLLNAHRDPSKNELVGAIMGLKRSDGTCVVAASWTDATLCSNIQNCQIQGTAIGLQSCEFDSSTLKTSLERLQSFKKAEFLLMNQCFSSGKNGGDCHRNWVSN